MIESDEKSKLYNYLQKWINDKIKTELESLLELKTLEKITRNLELYPIIYMRIMEKGKKRKYQHI